jgi:EKC/KEOPS complex subunit CGI121/TPRKB
METYHFPNFPTYASPVHIALFENVTNCSAMRKKLIAASTMEGEEGDKARSDVDYGFIDASLVCSPLHVLIQLDSAIILMGRWFLDNIL